MDALSEFLKLVLAAAQACYHGWSQVNTPLQDVPNRVENIEERSGVSSGRFGRYGTHLDARSARLDLIL